MDKNCYTAHGIEKLLQTCQWEAPANWISSTTNSNTDLNAPNRERDSQAEALNSQDFQASSFFTGTESSYQQVGVGDGYTYQNYDGSYYTTDPSYNPSTYTDTTNAYTNTHSNAYNSNNMYTAEPTTDNIQPDESAYPFPTHHTHNHPSIYFPDSTTHTAGQNYDPSVYPQEPLTCMSADTYTLESTYGNPSLATYTPTAPPLQSPLIHQVSINSISTNDGLSIDIEKVAMHILSNDTLLASLASRLGLIMKQETSADNTTATDNTTTNTTTANNDTTTIVNTATPTSDNNINNMHSGSNSSSLKPQLTIQTSSLDFNTDDAATLTATATNHNNNSNESIVGVGEQQQHSTAVDAYTSIANTDTNISIDQTYTSSTVYDYYSDTNNNIDNNTDNSIYTTNTISNTYDNDDEADQFIYDELMKEGLSGTGTGTHTGLDLNIPNLDSTTTTWKSLPEPDFQGEFNIYSNICIPYESTLNTINMNIQLLSATTLEAGIYEYAEFIYQPEVIYITNVRKELENVLEALDRNTKKEELLGQDINIHDLLLYGSPSLNEYMNNNNGNNSSDIKSIHSGTSGGEFSSYFSYYIHLIFVLFYSYFCLNFGLFSPYFALIFYRWW